MCLTSVGNPPTLGGGGCQCRYIRTNWYARRCRNLVDRIDGVGNRRNIRKIAIKFCYRWNRFLLYRFSHCLVFLSCPWITVRFRPVLEVKNAG